MATPVNIEGTEGNEKHKAKVTHEGALLVSQVEQAAPEVGSENILQYLQGRLGSTGLNTGTLDQSVDGSVTPQVFLVESSPDYDIHIIQATIIIADSAVVHNEFGTIPPLTNGWDLKLTEGGVETFIIEKAQTGGQVIVQSGFARPYGQGAASFELTNWTGSADAQTVSIPIGEFIPGGLRIGRGTTDKLESIVNDNLTGLTEFYVYIYGYKRFAEA